MKEIRVLGMRAMLCAVPSEREAARFAKFLSVPPREFTCVALHENFPFREYFQHLNAPDGGAVFDALLPDIAARLSHTDGTAYYCGDGTRDGEYLRLLCGHNRYVAADLPRGVELLGELRREYGLSVVSQPDAATVGRAQLAVLLSQPTRDIEFAPTCTVLADGDITVRGGVRVTGVETRVDAETPQGFDRAGLIGEAVRRGALDTRDVRIMKILTNA
ncbi:MAG: hypothetical protein LBN02_04645 [Oscillospiraceae bacterium]|nr:hypothetical protein [Oscillospiraceae bacterium]